MKIMQITFKYTTTAKTCSVCITNYFCLILEYQFLECSASSPNKFAFALISKVLKKKKKNK